MKVNWLFYVIGGLLLLVVYPALVSAWTIVSLTPHVEAKDFLLLIQITVTFLTTVGLALISLAASRSTETLRARLTLTVNDATEKLRSALQAQLEEVKTRINLIIPREHDAYHAMWKAATEYLRALQGLQDGKYPESEIDKAEEACKEAIGKSLLAQKDDIQQFYDFWQQATFIKDRASQVRGKSDDLIKFWDREGRQFGKMYNALGEKFEQTIRAL